MTRIVLALMAAIIVIVGLLMIIASVVWFGKWCGEMWNIYNAWIPLIHHTSDAAVVGYFSGTIFWIVFLVVIMDLFSDEKENEQ